MRIFIVGDHRTGTGPANVTKSYIEVTKKHSSIMCQKMVSKIMRVPELIIKIPLSDVILFSGYSKQNLLGLKLARIFNKPTAYLMHGCVEYENEINGVPDEEMTLCDNAVMAGVNRIFAVSERFAIWLKNKYPQFESKIDFVTNGVDRDAVLGMSELPGKNGCEIFSIGGGMPRKMIKYICSAIKILRDKGIDASLIVAGDKGLDTDEINSYPFVKNLGIVDKKTVCEIFNTSALFIQNSCFETFGLAPVESLANGCSVLLSEAVGALDIIKAAGENDIIRDYKDAHEIAQKIEYLLDNPNRDRLFNSIDFAECSWENRGLELCQKLRELLKK